MDQDCSKWLEEVDRLLKQRYYIDHIDAGWDDEMVRKFFEYEDTPKAFVTWFADKCQLNSAQDLWGFPILGSRAS
jgi:hypothetical protein